MHKGRALYSSYIPTSNVYNTLKKATDTCSVLQTCTGIVAMGEHYILQSGMELYNSRNSSVKSFIKSDCTSGRFGLLCEFKCPPCQQGMACNPYTGLCGDTVFCSKENSPIPCGKGSIFGGTCPVEDGWQYWQGSCYYIHTAKRQTWLRARDLCRRYRDTDLLWLTSPGEKEWLVSKLPKASFWTGLYGFRFCTVLQWSNSQFLFAASRWLSVSKWAIGAKCCVQLNAPKGSLTGFSCFRKAPWICKRKEEGIVDFREFRGYYLAGTYTSNSTQRSLWEALQLCRFQQSICNGVGMIKGEYRTIFATRILLIIGALGDESAAYLKSPCHPGHYGPECQGSCTCNRIENCSPFTGECAENLQCSQEYVAQQCQKGLDNLSVTETCLDFLVGCLAKRCGEIKQEESACHLAAKDTMVLIVKRNVPPVSIIPCAIDSQGCVMVQ
ncbi:uncharacterized protein LOC116837230 [Chelonoidis abingdonii]|uniref:uncharacterized protein LOC116837230 n=1 Tax=Chelonoidis abingdonii TaxID=106734 RepID=UPI003F492752